MRKFAKKILIILKYLLVFAIFYYIFHLFNFKKFVFYLKHVNFLFFSLAILCMFIGFVLNIYKWYFILKTHISVSKKEVIRSIFGGYTLSLVTPARVGEYGRFLFITHKDKRGIILLTFLDKIFNISITVLVGLTLFIYRGIKAPLFLKIFAFFVAFSVVFFLFLYIFKSRALYMFLIKFKFLRNDKIKSFFQFLKQDGKKEKLYIFLFSFIIYVMFMMEFSFFSASFLKDTFLIGGESFAIALLWKSIIPITVAELGIKEFLLIELYRLNNVSIEIAMASALFIYFFNIFLPALIGTFYLLPLLKRRNYEK